MSVLSPDPKIIASNMQAAIDEHERNCARVEAPSAIRRTRVYVSGPLTTGMLTKNVTHACQVAMELLRRGYAVYLPHTNILWEIATPADDPYETWLAHDFEWVLACDVMLRLDGESSGGDREVALAVNRHKPVYRSLDTLVACESPRRPDETVQAARTAS